MTRCLVTGGAGFIGSHLVDRLVRDGHEVTVLDNLSNGSLSNLDGASGAIKVTQGDVRDRADCEEVMKGIEVVFHEAALGSVPRSIIDPRTTHENNVDGLLNLLEFARKYKVRRFISASSSSVYGDVLAHEKAEWMPPRPRSPYAASKVTGESYCRAYYHAYGLETISLRYFNVFGPRQRPDGPYAAVIPRFIDAVKKGDPVKIYGDGFQSRDFTFVENVVHANILAMKALPAACGRAYNVGTGTSVTVNELAELVGELINGHSPDIDYLDPRAGDVRDSQASIKLAQENLGYTPLVDFPEGLSLTVLA